MSALVPSCGRGGGVRGPPLEVEREPERRERGVREDVAVEGVEHHRRVDPLERARLDEPDLAAPAFLGRRSEQHDLPPDLLDDARRGEERPDPARGDEVVPAGVPDLGERVVLGEDGDARLRRTSRRAPEARSASRRCRARPSDVAR